MKILHISTYDYGGAGNAALRLHQGLIEAGYNSIFLTRFKKTNVQGVVQYPAVEKTRFYFRYLQQIGVLKTREKEKLKIISNTDKNFEMLSIPNTDFRVENHPLVASADIINLHWVADFVNYPSFFSHIKKPIVWTLHDMNPFMGVFHYSNDKFNNPGLNKIEDLYINIKKQALESRIIDIVCPSKWLMKESQKSNLFGNFRHHHIPYGVDMNLFRPIDKIIARDILRLPANKCIILFLAQSLDNKRKGYCLLKEAISKMKETANILLCAVGNRIAEEMDEIFWLDYINDDRLLPLVYSAADAFILPSLEDNLPNTMIESLACGTPVLSFPVGGMLDVIRNGDTGLLANSIDHFGLVEVIENFYKMKNRFETEKIRDIAINNFSFGNQTDNYVRLYEMITSEYSES